MRIPPDGPRAELPSRSRRLVIAELVGAAIVIAIPVGALIATARPIENPPDLRSLQSPRAPETLRQPKRKAKRPRKVETRIRDDQRRMREEQRAERAKGDEAKTQ